MAKKEENSKEELTTKMHSEFGVPVNIEIQHKAWSALASIDDRDFTYEEALKEYNISKEELEKYRKSYEELKDE